MSVKLELYRVFKEVAEAGNITAAAYQTNRICFRRIRLSFISRAFRIISVFRADNTRRSNPIAGSVTPPRAARS